MLLDALRPPEERSFALSGSNWDSLQVKGISFLFIEETFIVIIVIIETVDFTFIRIWWWLTLLAHSPAPFFWIKYVRLTVHWQTGRSGSYRNYPFTVIFPLMQFTQLITVIVGCRLILLNPPSTYLVFIKNHLVTNKKNWLNSKLKSSVDIFVFIIDWMH